MSEKTKIAIQRIKDDDVKTAVFSALEMIKAQKLMKKDGMIVLLKPNVLSAKPPKRAVTTNPEVIRSVIQWVKQFNPSKIYVCDSSGGHKPGVTENSMKVSGILTVCEEEGAECVPFEKTEREIYKVSDPLELKEFTSSRLIKEADIIINLPKIKTHGQCLLTCCIKNMFGTILLSNKTKTHARFSMITRFSSALADIYSVSNPQITVIDGYTCQEGNGPASGDIVKMNLILAGYDGVALDTTVCKIIGFNPEDVIHLIKAEQKKLGTTNLDNIEHMGEKIEDVYREFKKPKLHPISIPLPKWLADYIGRQIFKATVKFDSNKCRLCATCWDNCPVNAITPPTEIKKGNIPKWDKKRCITCYCCVELCPHEAVNFKINYVKNAMFSWLGVGFVFFLIAFIWILTWIF